MTRFLPVFAMLGAILLWSTAAPFTKLALGYVGVWEVIVFRLAVAAAFMWAVVLIAFGLINLRKVGPWPFLMGVFEPGLVTTFIVIGIAHTSAVNGAVVWGILPVTQPILARLVLKEPLQLPVVIGAVFAVGGAALLFSTKQSEGTGTLFGDAMLVLAVLSAAGNQLLARRVAQRMRNPLVVTACQMVTAAVIAAVLFTATASDGATAYANVTLPVFGLLCYLVVTTAGPFMLYNYSLQHLPVGAISLFAPLAGPLGALWAGLLLDDVVSPVGIAAIVVILTGAMMPSLAPIIRARLRRPRGFATGD